MRRLTAGLSRSVSTAFIFMDRAQHSAGKTLLESVRLGDLRGIGMTIIDGIVRCASQPQHAARGEGAGRRRLDEAR